MGDKILSETHIILQIIECDFRLNHPEFCQVTAGFGFFSTECRSKTVDFTKSHCRRFAIQLSGLGQIGFASEIISGKKRCGPFRGIRCEDRCIDQDKIAGVEKFPGRADDFMTDTHNSMLACRTQPQVPVVHKEINAMLLFTDWIFFTDLNDLNLTDLYFKTDR